MAQPKERRGERSNDATTVLENLSATPVCISKGRAGEVGLCFPPMVAIPMGSSQDEHLITLRMILRPKQRLGCTTQYPNANQAFH
jgi:hypothetical protein